MPGVQVFVAVLLKLFQDQSRTKQLHCLADLLYTMTTEAQILRPDVLEDSRPAWTDNRRFLTQYRGEDLWHERLIVRRVTGQEFSVATPDGDVYLETIRLDGGIRMPPK